MLWRWWPAPWWVLGLGQGLLFAVLTGGLTVVGGVSVGSAVLSAVIGGVVFGVVTGRTAVRARDGLLVDVPADVPPEQRREGYRAAHRGPVPTHPVVRAVALLVLRRRMDAAQQGRVRQMVVMALLVAVYLWMGLTGSRWWLAAAGLFLGFVVVAWAEPRRLARRWQRLEAARV